jgi:hypothetical protein
MKHLKKILAIGAVSLGLFAFAAAPANAAAAGAGVFTGSATLEANGAGLSYPVSPGCGTPVGICPNGVTGTWSLTTDIGVGVGTDGTDVAAGGLSIIDVHGRVHENVVGVGAYCGISGGTQTIAAGENPRVEVDTSIAGTATVSTSVNGIRWLSSAATVIVFENLTTNTNGVNVVGVASAIPPVPLPGADSCTNNSAKTFTVVGASALVQVP